MTSLTKGILWATGCLVLVFALSIGLSWVYYGVLDLPTVMVMGAMLLPVLGAAALLIGWSQRRGEEERFSPPPPPLRRRRELWEIKVPNRKE